MLLPFKFSCTANKAALCTHHYDAGDDKEPTCSPPQPKCGGLHSNHHLNVFNKTVSPCKVEEEYKYPGI